MSRPLNPFMPKAATLPNTGDKEYLPLVRSLGGGFLKCVPQLLFSTEGEQPGPSVGTVGKDKDKALPSFWIPSLTPEAKATKLEKPVSAQCPEFPPLLSVLPAPHAPSTAHMADPDCPSPLLTLPLPIVPHGDLPDVREATAHVGPDVSALHTAGRFRGPRGAHHTQ